MGKKNKKAIVRKKGNRLTASEQRTLEINIREYIGKNYNPTQIMDELDIQPHILAQYLQRIQDLDKEKFEGLSSVSVYSEYLAKSDQMIKELDKLKTKFQNRGQWTALVAAIKEKRSIYNDCLKLGQEFGFIQKTKTELFLESEMTFATMSKEEVEAELKKSVAEMNQMVNADVIEMRPELLESLDEDTEAIQKYIPKDKLRTEGKLVKKKIRMILRK